MTARSIVAADGTGTWDRLSLLSAGYEPTGITCTEAQVSLGRTQDLAFEIDVTMASLQASRTGPIGGADEFEYFLIPGWTKGFCGSPLLPL